MVAGYWRELVVECIMVAGPLLPLFVCEVTGFGECFGLCALFLCSGGRWLLSGAKECLVGIPLLVF